MMQSIPLLSPAASGNRDGDGSLQRAVEGICRHLRSAPAVTLVVNDPQRATRTAAVLERMREGLANKHLRALVATGTHHYQAQRRRRFQADVLSGIRFDSVAWHDCDSAELVAVGQAPAWRCHRWLLEESRPVLAIGSCEPHYFAGITGAHKTATVGCAAAADVQANHALALSPDARPGRLEGNPVHEAIAAMLAGLTARNEVLAINLLQVGESILSASWGSPLEALQELAPRVRSTYICRIESAADALVLIVDGVPGRCFYQADKAIKNNEWAVRDGGCLVLRAPCPDGIGQDHFMRLLRDCPSYESADAAVRRNGYRLGDHKAIKLRYLTDRRAVRVFAVSPGLSDRELLALGFTRARNVQQALSSAGIDPAKDHVCRVADAANTCVLVGS